MYSWIDPQGSVIRTDTIKQFAEQYGFNYSHARDLACGWMQRYKGWCSVHKSASKARSRFLTVLVNTRDNNRRFILGQTITKFAATHGLSKNSVHQVILGRKIATNGWMLERTLQNAQATATGVNF